MDWSSRFAEHWCRKNIRVMPQDNSDQSQREEAEKHQQQELGTEVQDQSEMDEDTWLSAATNGSHDDGSSESAGNAYPGCAGDRVEGSGTSSFSIQRWLEQMPPEQPWTALTLDSTTSNGAFGSRDSNSNVR
jgi:hypothetical protein